MFKKLLSLLNIKSWLENFVLKVVLGKGVKHATTVLVGIIMGAKVQPILSAYGVNVDPTVLQAQLTVLFGGLAGSLMNWAMKVMDKDGDGLPG